MPEYVNDDEIPFALRAWERLEEMALRLATVARPSEADTRQMQESAVSVRVVLERAEARGKVH